MLAIVKFLQDINPLTTKVTDEDGNISVVGRKPRQTDSAKKLQGLFVLNPKPFILSQLEKLVEDYNPLLCVRETEPKRTADGNIPAMVWVGQDFAESTDEELADFMEGL